MIDQGGDYRIRVAGTSEIDLIMGLLDEATAWLADLGLDQWQANRDKRREHVATDLGEETVFVVEHRERVVATITVDRLADDDFWRPGDDIHAALYAHRMAVTRDEAGMGLGSAMLNWAGERAESCGRSLVRLDAWSTNDKLHAYYQRLDFTMVRNTPVEGRGSGALFERKASIRRGVGPKLVDLVRDPTDGAGGTHGHGRPASMALTTRYGVIHVRVRSHSRRSASGLARSGSW